MTTSSEPSASPGAVARAKPVEFTDLDLLAGIVHIAIRAPRRHPRLAVFVSCLTVALSIAGAVLVPRTYVAESRIIVQRNDVIPSLGNPSRSVGASADAPSRGVEGTIFTQDNLIAVAKDVNLVDRWKSQRSGIMRMKDAVSSAIFGPMSEEDHLRAVLGVLEKRVRVQTSDQAVVIGVEWDTPQTAYEVLYSVHKRFIDTRFSDEVSKISEAIAILQSTAQKESDNVVAAIEELRQLRAGRGPDAARTTRPLAARAPRSVGSSAAPTDPKDQELERALEERRAAIEAASRDHENRLNALRAERTQLRTTYASAHPLVIAVERKIEAMGSEPQQLSALRQEERTLLGQLAAREAGRAGDRRQRRWSAPAGADAAEQRGAASAAGALSDEVAYQVAGEKLENASQKSNELVDRIRAAEIELETSKAAFKYKYRVAKAPEVPHKPKKPIGLVLVCGGFVLAFVLVIFICAIADLASGHFIETWQIRQHMRVPVLGELDAFEDSPPDARPLDVAR